MPFPLHKSPKGLLELFRLRTQGGQPSQFAEQVSPTVDVTDYYAQDLLASNVSTAAASALGIVQISQLVDGPQRYVGLAARLTLGANAGTYVRGRLFVAVPTNANTAHIGYVESLKPIPAESVVVLAAQLPLVLPAGALIGVAWSGDATGNDHVSRIEVLTQQLNAPAI